MKSSRFPRRTISILIIIAILLIVFVFYVHHKPYPEVTNVVTSDCITSTPEESIPDYESQKVLIEERCRKIVSLYVDYYAAAEKHPPQNSWDSFSLSDESISHIEQLLISAGYQVIISNGTYPAYLNNPEAFLSFWEKAQQNIDTEYEIIHIAPSGSFSYDLFIYINGTAYYCRMIYSFDQDHVPFVVNFEQHTVLDWELSENGNFYFRIYPAGDKHYADYALIRLYPPNKELVDMTEKYISPIGYNAVNLFLIDWSEKDFGAVSFNDLWDALYFKRYGQQFVPDDSRLHADPYFYQIPADEFESIILPYFNIDLNDLRTKAHYNAEGNYYPWRPFLTNDVVWYYYPTTFPEVKSYRMNSDGTMTLSVEVLSTDLKTDCLFSHDVTVRPLENGSFQYVGNQTTYQTEYGLPPAESRFEVDQMGIY